ncbi:MAG: hypothetical protein HC831_18630, partial [Chloroflexia bacterium]|nr:hypothetical protein [Chloroflexia bacterium]
MKPPVKNLFNLLFIIICFFGSITCEQYELIRLTKLSTGSITEITSTSAKASGLFGDVSSNISEFGHCWSTEKEPEITDNKTTATGTAKRAGEIITELSGLLPETVYYVRAYAMVNGEPVYGDEVPFTTSIYVAPAISTTIVSAIDHESAVSGGNITNDGGQTIIARGVCWSTTENPTIDNDKTMDGTGTGVFSSQLTGLQASTNYYVRAYATTSLTTSYGEQRSFSTTEAKVITITTPGTDSHWGGGSKFNISWTDNITENVTIQLYKNDVYEANIEGGAGIASTSPYEWTVPVGLDDGSDYKIKITSVDDDKIFGFSVPFEIGKP